MCLLRAAYLGIQGLGKVWDDPCSAHPPSLPCRWQIPGDSPKSHR